MKKKICVIGLGYVGLPTAALLAETGYGVIGVDTNEKIIDALNVGDIHIQEEGLAEIVKKAVGNGCLSTCTSPSSADIFIIAVPTPLKDDYIPNIDHVLSAAHSIAPHLKAGNLVILESTSPVGTTEMIARQFADCAAPDDIDIAYCPERILPGSTLKELVENNRVIGGLTPSAAERARDFYATFVTGSFFLTDARTAEMTKLVENAYRNVNIAFANELSMICDESNINVWDVIRCANQHPRVNVLAPSPGVGGHCIAVDPLFISHKARDSAKLISTAHRRNEEKTKWVLEKIRHAAYQFMQENHRPPVIVALGISYKPNSDDIRESPSKKIAEELMREQYHVRVFDPHIMKDKCIVPSYSRDQLTSADIIVYLVAHDEFRTLPLKKDAIVLDFCGITQ